MLMKQIRKPTHPGEILYYDILEPLGLSITEAAKYLGVSRKTVSELISGKIALSPLMAIRIAIATSTTPESWLYMQTKLDLWKARKKAVKNVVKLPTAA
jgi:antitoxin HigA-1